MTMGRIDDDNIDFGSNQGGQAIHQIRPDPYRSSGQQSAFAIFGRVRIFLPFFDIFDRNQAFEIPFVINQRQFLDPMLAENLFRIFQRGSHRCRD